MLGRDRTRKLYAGLLMGTFLSLAVFVAGGWVPTATAMAVFWAPFAVPLIRTVSTEVAGPPLIGVLKGTARLELLVGLSMTVGAALG